MDRDDEIRRLQHEIAELRALVQRLAAALAVGGRT